MDRKEMERMARRLKTLKSRQENLQQEIDQIEEDLKQEMEKLNLEEVKAGIFRVTWKQIVSSRFDSKRFREENGELYQLYTVPNCYRKFSVV